MDLYSNKNIIITIVIIIKNWNNTPYFDRIIFSNKMISSKNIKFMFTLQGFLSFSENIEQ